METLIHNGRSYKLQPLGFQELLDHAKWLRDRVIREAREHIAGVPADIAAHTFEMATVRAERIRVGTPEFRQATLHDESLAEIAYRAMQRENKEAAMNDAFEAVNASEDNFWAVAGALGFKRPPQEPKTPGAAA